MENFNVLQSNRSHEYNCFVKAKTECGEKKSQCRLMIDPEMIMKLFGEREMDQKVVTESTSGWYWLNDLFESRKT